MAPKASSTLTLSLIGSQKLALGAGWMDVSHLTKTKTGSLADRSLRQEPNIDVRKERKKGQEHIEFVIMYKKSK
jgi:hypothetical protein